LFRRSLISTFPLPTSRYLEFSARLAVYLFPTPRSCENFSHFAPSGCRDRLRFFPRPGRDFPIPVLPFSCFASSPRIHLQISVLEFVFFLASEGWVALTADNLQLFDPPSTPANRPADGKTRSKIPPLVQPAQLFIRALLMASLSSDSPLARPHQRPIPQVGAFHSQLPSADLPSFLFSPLQRIEDKFLLWEPLDFFVYFYLYSYTLFYRLCRRYPLNFSDSTPCVYQIRTSFRCRAERHFGPNLMTVRGCCPAAQTYVRTTIFRVLLKSSGLCLVIHESVK